MISLILIISFVLEGVFSNLVSSNSILFPLFTIVSLATIYPLFNKDKKMFYAYTAFVGVMYDIVYTNTPFINTFSYLITAYMICLIYEYITVSKFNIILISIIVILFHQTVLYLLLCLFKYTTFNEVTLLTNLYSSLIVNVIYSFILFFIVQHIKKKRDYRYRNFI